MNISKKITILGIGALMGASLIIGAAPMSSATSNDGKVKTYIATAEKSFSGNPEALTELNKFKNLPIDKQEQFVNFVTDPTRVNTMYDALADTANDKSTVLLNGDMQVKSSADKAANNNVRETRAAVANSATTVFKKDAEYLGVRVAGTQISLTFSYNTDAVTSIQACTPSGFNYFPLRTMANDAPNSWIDGKNAYCEVRWTIANGWVNGLNLGQRSFIHKAGQGPWGQIENSLRDA